MTDSHSAAKDTARLGRQLLMRALEQRGATGVAEMQSGNRFTVTMRASGGKSCEIKVKTRRSGTWHAHGKDGDPNATDALETHFWVFVDLAEGAESPSFFVVPEGWMKADIDAVHSAYLADHGGARPVNPESGHHGIQIHRIEKWRDRWDLLGL